MKDSVHSLLIRFIIKKTANGERICSLLAVFCDLIAAMNTTCLYPIIYFK